MRRCRLVRPAAPRPRESSPWTARWSLGSSPPLLSRRLPLPSGLPASLPASPRRDGERQACYKLVLSPRRLPLITSRGGHKGRPGGRAGLLSEGRSLTQLSTLGPARAHFAPHWPRRRPTPPGSGGDGRTDTACRADTQPRVSSVKGFPFFFSPSAMNGNSLGTTERQGEIKKFSLIACRNVATHQSVMLWHFLTLHQHLYNEANASESSAWIQKKGHR